MGSTLNKEMREAEIPSGHGKNILILLWLVGFKGDIGKKGHFIS